MARVRPLYLDANGQHRQAADADTVLAGLGDATQTIFSQTTSRTVTNTATDTTSIGTGVGSLTLPAGFWTPGRTVRIKGGGYYTTPLSSLITTKVWFGATALSASNTNALANSQTNASWTFEVAIVCQSVTGSTGTFQVIGQLLFYIGTMSPAANFVTSSPTTAPTATVDTAKLLDVTNAWDAASTTRSVTTTVATVQVLR